MLVKDLFAILQNGSAIGTYRQQHATHHHHIFAKGGRNEKRWQYARTGSYGQSKSVLRFVAPPLVKGVAGQLLERHAGERVELALVEHYLPAPEELTAVEKGPMDDIVTPLGAYARAGEGRGP